MDAYTVLGRIGEGAHGVVVRAKHNLTGKTVALKKIPLRRLDQGMPTTALREIKALREINSQHVSFFCFPIFLLFLSFIFNFVIFSLLFFLLLLLSSLFAFPSPSVDRSSPFPIPSSSYFISSSSSYH